MLTVGRVLPHLLENWPLHLVSSARSLQLPGELGELGVVLFALVLQARLVIGVSFLEYCHCKANIFHGGASTLHSNACLKDHVLGKAFSSQWACLFSSSAVATWLSLQILPGCKGANAGIVRKTLRVVSISVLSLSDDRFCSMKLRVTETRTWFRPFPICIYI